MLAPCAAREPGPALRAPLTCVGSDDVEERSTPEILGAQPRTIFRNITIPVYRTQRRVRPLWFGMCVKIVLIGWTAYRAVRTGSAETRQMRLGCASYHLRV